MEPMSNRYWVVSLPVVRLVLCICGTRGKGTLHMYPPLRVPTKNCKGMEPGLVDISLHFMFGHLFFGVVVALVHSTNKVEGFDFFQGDDIDVLALLLLFVELTATFWLEGQYQI
jgi:hypothetical protein